MSDGITTNPQFIRKRDGRIVPFDIEKITEAIFKAAKAVGGTDRGAAVHIAESVVDILSILYKDEHIPTVENVQDLVEKMLIEKGHAKVAKAYILYREQHRKIRESKDLLNEGIQLIEDYLDRSDWRVNENSNMSYSLQGLNNHIASAITAKYWLERIYPPEIRDAHTNCELHLHDLGLLSAYCVGWDLRDLLLTGFGGVPGKVESRPAKHFRSSLGQIVNFFYTLQGESAGAQAFANFDTYLAPFIRYDNLDYAGV
ncbi:MAG: ribonucleoside triphosphate reductase, partial [Spirochaetes bacterium]|nr:ribonucleoside triphosphate reductase [Spirochaetota bacterium]